MVNYMYKLDVFLLVAMTAAAVWTVMRGSLLRAVIALALTSIALTAIMFRLGAPIAAVFELSVCAGLITVVFMSTVSLTKPLTREETVEYTKDRMKRFWIMPVFMAIAASVLLYITIPLNFTLPAAPTTIQNFREVLWGERQFDLLGQILIILAGVFGVVVLFKHHTKDEPEE
jgi:NADH-quinone oxidoreductase subunit J